MEVSFFAWGESIDVNQIDDSSVYMCLKAATKHNFVKFIEVRRNGDDVGLIFDLQAQIPSRPVADIRPSERILIIFSPKSISYQKLERCVKIFPRICLI